jgi:hypothetical protein
VPPAAGAVTASAVPGAGASRPSSSSSVGSVASAAGWAASHASSTAYALGAAVGEVRSALRVPMFDGDSPNSRAERWRRKSRLRRVRWAGRDRDVDHALRVAARFDRNKRWRQRPVNLARSFGSFGLFLGFVLALAVAIDVPSMIAAGFPDAQLGPTIAREVFGGQVADWPTLAQPLLVLAASVMMLIGLIGTMVARRNAGAMHMLRAMFGVGLLVLAILPIAVVFGSLKPWHEVAMLPMAQRSLWLVVRVVLEHDNVGKGLIVPIVTAAFGAFLLALPPRREVSSARATGSTSAPSAGTTATTTSTAESAPTSAPGSGGVAK